MKQSPPPFTTIAPAWTSSKPPLLRFLNACHADFAPETSGAVADYIPELGKADPAHFGISLATLDGHVYEVGDTQIPFTIQSMSKPFVFALALDTLGAARVESVIGVEPSGDPFNSIRLNADNHPFNPMVNAGAIACSGLIHEAKGDAAFEYIRQALGRFAGRDLDVDDAVFASESTTGDRNRAIGYLLRTNAVIRDNVAVGARRLLPAMRHPGDGARYRRDGGNAGQPRHQSRDRRAGHERLRHRAHAVRHDQFRHVRLCRRMDLPRRHPRQERRRRRHPRRAAGSARARQLFAEARQARQQRARHQGLRGAVVALRPAYAQPQRRRPQQHHRRLRHRQQPVATRPARARTEHSRRTSRGCPRHRTGRDAVVLQRRLRLAAARGKAAPAARHFRPPPRHRHDPRRHPPARRGVS